MDEWVKGLKIDSETNYIIAWTSSTVCFFKLSRNGHEPQGKVLLKYDELTPKEDFITDILIYLEIKCFVTAT